MEEERQWSEEFLIATKDGLGNWFYQHSDRRLGWMPKKALSDLETKLQNEKTCFPNVSMPRRQWLKDVFFYACSGGKLVVGHPPPPDPDDEYDDISSYLDAESPIYGQPFLYLPTIEVGQQLNVLDLLGDKLLSFNTCSQNIPNIQPLRDPKMDADRVFRGMSKLSIGKPRKRKPNVQRIQPPEFKSCVDDVVRSSTVMACTSITTPGEEDVNVESTLNLKGKYVMICCVFVPSMWSSEDGDMIYHTALASHELAKRDDFVLVVVPMMRKGFTHSCSAYQHFLSGFSCLAVPFHDPYRREHICSALHFDGKIKACILDPSQKVIYHGPPDMFLEFGVAEDGFFPFTPGRGKICSRLDNVLQDRSLNELLGLSDTDVLYNIEYVTGGRLKEDGCITISELKKHKFVGLYVCSEGISLSRLHEVYKECKQKEYDLEIVVVCFPFIMQVPPELQEELIIDALARLKLPGWWYFPFNDAVCHRLWRMREIDSLEESLFIVDPIKKCVDPYGMPILYDFGINGYPFTRGGLVNNELQRVRGLRLNSLLPSTYVCRKLDSGSIAEIPVAQVLKNKFVVLYIIYEEEVGKSFVDKLAAWYKNNIKGKHSNVEVVTCSIDGRGGTRDNYFMDMGWLVCPAHPNSIGGCSSTLGILHPHREIYELLVAFDGDGRIQSLDALRLLKSKGPPFHGNLRAEIGRELCHAGFDYLQHYC